MGRHEKKKVDNNVLPRYNTLLATSAPSACPADDTLIRTGIRAQQPTDARISHDDCPTGVPLPSS